MPAVETPNQFGDPTLSEAEAYSACGPAAAVAFARANGRNPTLREAVDLAKRVGWTTAGGMNGVANQKRLLDQMGVPAELDTNASPQTIAERAKAGQNVTVSTPVHYYVVDGYDERTGRVHVGQSGLARRGGSAWMTIADIADRDGGINGALYQTVSNPGGAEMDRPPSEFEPPSRFPVPTPVPTRGSRMQARIDELRAAKAAKQAQIDALQKPGPDEIPTSPSQRVDPRWESQATQARQNRELELRQRHQELVQIDTQMGAAQTDLANDPDVKPVDPVKAQHDQVTLDAAKLALAEAQKKAAAASTSEGKRLAELEVRKAELGIQQAEATLENTRNPRPPQRAPRYPDEVVKAGLDNTKTQLDIQQAQKDLLPKQQQILQAHHDTVTYVQGMLERGEIDPSQADAYIKLSKDAAESGLRGTTPFQEMDARRKAEQERQTLGKDLLNQRLSSGGALASSLLSATSSLAGNAMLRPGQTSLGVDPLAQLMPLLNSLQGGSDVTPFARGLLMGAPGGAPPQQPMQAGL